MEWNRLESPVQSCSSLGQSRDKSVQCPTLCEQCSLGGFHSLDGGLMLDECGYFGRDEEKEPDGRNEGCGAEEPVSDVDLDELIEERKGSDLEVFLGPYVVDHVPGDIPLLIDWHLCSNALFCLLRSQLWVPGQ
mmetsp:Transcript_6758/g.13793  ORF Transcript_6758/g.13793 Transcript_6758/m.13793 type:complete len:134 (-) Transcript_6758:4715-5116(-)